MTKHLLICLASLFLLGCVIQEKETKEVNAFKEKHRPQFHFSPPSQWMNDPNGMFYYEGEYHLFYQYFPDSNVWGPMHWGHAVSKDMIKWEHFPIALYPDSLGYIFSGSAVVDWNNSSGFGNGKEPPIVAIFTYHDPQGVQSNRIDFQYQGIAYSLDKGRTWEKYAKNPVLSNPGVKDFRDPKVAWHEKSEKWIMTLAVQDHISIYSSKNLQEWKFESDFGLEWGSHGGVWECPDLFQLKVEGIEEAKWVLLVSINPGGPQDGSGTQYFIGDFDGTTFRLDENFKVEVLNEQAVWLDYGADNYAGVTWSDIPKSDGRKLFIGWMSNWQYAQVVPTTRWRSAMTLPRELTLVKVNDSFRIKSSPVKEMRDYLGQKEIKRHDTIKDTSFLLKASVDGVFEIKLSNELDEYVVIKVVNDDTSDADGVFPMLIFDRTNAGISDFHDQFGRQHLVPLNDLDLSSIEVYVDTSSIEVFVNDGALVVTELVFPNQPYRKIETSGDIEALTYQPIRSIWD